MNPKFLSIALITSVISLSAQQIQNRAVLPFNKLKTSGSVNVIYTNSDSAAITVQAAEKEIDNVETKFENSTLTIHNKGRFTMPVIVYVKNAGLTEIQSNGASTFKTTNTIKADSITLNVTGSANIIANIESRSVKALQSGAGNLKLSGTSTNLFAELTGASELKAYDLITEKATVTATGASTAKIFVNQKLTASASDAGSIKIKGDAKDIDAEATTAANIVKIADQNKASVKTGKDSTIYTWKRKKIIIVDRGSGGPSDTIKIKHKYGSDDFNHWAGFSIGVNGYVGSNGSIALPKASNYMDLNYARSFNFQFNLIERHINIIKNNFKIVTGFGFDYHSYALDRNTNLNPNSDSPASFASVDTSNTYSYSKNKFRATYIQVPLLLEFNSSNNARKSFHIAFGVVGQYLISSRTKQELQAGGFEFIKQKKDSYNLNPFAAKAHINLGYKWFTLFGEYGLVSMFQAGKGPQLNPFSIGVRLIPFN